MHDAHEPRQHLAQCLEIRPDLVCLNLIKRVQVRGQLDQDAGFSCGAGGDSQKTFQVTLRAATESFADVGSDRNRCSFDLTAETESLPLG